MNKPSRSLLYSAISNIEYSFHSRNYRFYTTCTVTLKSKRIVEACSISFNVKGEPGVEKALARKKAIEIIQNMYIEGDLNIKDDISNVFPLPVHNHNEVTDNISLQHEQSCS